MISALLLAAILGPGEADYTTCLRVYALKYGANNTESVETIMKIARGECVTFVRAVEADVDRAALYAQLSGIRSGESKEEVMERAEGEAVKALLEARAPAKPQK